MSIVKWHDSKTCIFIEKKERKEKQKPVFPDLYFPVFGLNTEIRIREISVFGHLLHSVNATASEHFTIQRRSGDPHKDIRRRVLQQQFPSFIH